MYRRNGVCRSDEGAAPPLPCAGAGVVAVPWITPASKKEEKEERVLLNVMRKGEDEGKERRKRAEN